jgi:hypothetical protein
MSAFRKDTSLVSLTPAEISALKNKSAPITEVIVLTHRSGNLISDLDANDPDLILRI